VTYANIGKQSGPYGSIGKQRKAEENIGNIRGHRKPKQRKT
jgi:hypothetical protein